MEEGFCPLWKETCTSWEKFGILCLMTKGKILIAEDDAVLRSLYVKKFSVEGYAVVTAEDGEQALKLIRDEKPQMVILDIHMPKMDGFQVLQQFPKQNRQFPVIMLTNFDQADFNLKAMELGADDYFVKKDMTIKALVDMVGRHAHL
jgi:DNA-binding response OmpR family regulator